MKNFYSKKKNGQSKPIQQLNQNDFQNVSDGTPSLTSMSDEKMHHGFTSYRRKSKHFLDEHGEIPPPLFVSLEDINSPSSRKPGKGLMKNISERAKRLSNYSYSDGSLQSSNSQKQFKKTKKAGNKKTATRELQFHPEDEVKEYIVQPESYKLGNKDPFGLDILAHVDQLWLEHTAHSMGSLPGYYYQYNVFDDSEQRILFLRPNFDYVEDYQEGTDKAPTVPTSFRVFTAVGMDICRLNFKSTFCCTKTQMKVEVSHRGHPIGYITLISNNFDVSDADGQHLMKMAVLGSTEKPKFRWCFSTKNNKKIKKRLVPPDKEFKCNIYLTHGGNGPHDSQVDQLFGVINQNGESREEVVRGEPRGFYFFIENQKENKTLQAGNLYKLYTLATLLTLTLHYKHEVILSNEKNEALAQFSSNDDIHDDRKTPEGIVDEGTIS